MNISSLHALGFQKSIQYDIAYLLYQWQLKKYEKHK